MSDAFPTLKRHEAGSYSIAIVPDLAVGPPGHAYLFGGASLALAFDAASNMTGRPVVQGALQFVSFTPLGAELELAVEVLQEGKTLAQVRVSGRVEDRLVFHAGVALGAREGFATEQWNNPPTVPAPDDCPPCTTLPPQDADARFLAGIDVREAGATPGVLGRTFLWLMRRDAAPLDTSSLAMFADFVPLALGRATGRNGGGNSLDNSLRMVRAAPPGWCLCDIEVKAAHGGFAQGMVALWDAGGNLLATGAQSLLMKG